MNTLTTAIKLNDSNVSSIEFTVDFKSQQIIGIFVIGKNLTPLKDPLDKIYNEQDWRWSRVPALHQTKLSIQFDRYTYDQTKFLATIDALKVVLDEKNFKELQRVLQEKKDLLLMKREWNLNDLYDQTNFATSKTAVKILLMIRNRDTENMWQRLPNELVFPVCSNDPMFLKKLLANNQNQQPSNVQSDMDMDPEPMTKRQKQQ